MPTVDTEQVAYKQAAFRECIAYGEHGNLIETTEQGANICFNCGGAL